MGHLKRPRLTLDEQWIAARRRATEGQLRFSAQRARRVERGVITAADAGAYDVQVPGRAAPWSALRSCVGEHEVDDEVLVGFLQVGHQQTDWLPMIIGSVGAGSLPATVNFQLPLFDWIQSLVNPYLSLSLRANCPAPTTGVTTLVTIAQDAQAAAGMERLVGLVSLGDCWVMLSYRANAALTQYEWVRIRAYEWNHSIRWNTVLSITPRTFAEVSSIPYSSNLFWDPELKELVMLDFEARAWPIPNTAVAPVANNNRTGPFRRFAGYAPGGSMLHHNGNQLIHYPYSAGAWGVLPAVKIHPLANFDPPGHTLFNSGTASTTMLDNNRCLNRPWAYSEGFWYALVSSQGGGTSCLNFMKISGETGEVVVSTQARWSAVPTEYIPTPIHDAAQAAGVPSLFGGNPNGSGVNVVSGEKLYFKVYDPTTLAYIGLRGQGQSPGNESPLVSFSSSPATNQSKITYWTVPNPDYPAGPGEAGELPDLRQFGAAVGSALGNPPTSQPAPHFTPLPQPASLTASSNMNAGSLLPGTLINGAGNIVLPHLEIVAYSWKLAACPPFDQLAISGTWVLDDYFVLESAAVNDSYYEVTPDFPPGAPPVPFRAYETAISAKLGRTLAYHAASCLSYFSADGNYVGRVEVSPRIPSYTGPSNNSVTPQWADLVPFNENIWQVASGLTGTIKGCEFVAHDAREHNNTEPRLMLTVIKDRQVVWRSGLLGNQDRHATTETNPALQPFFPGKFKFQYSGQTAGFPQVRVWTDEQDRSFLLLGLWMRKTTNGTTPDTAASDQWSTNIWAYEVTNPASPVLVDHFTASANSQGSVTLPKGEDFARMIIADGQIFWISKIGSDFKIQGLS